MVCFLFIPSFLCWKLFRVKNIVKLSLVKTAVDSLNLELMFLENLIGSEFKESGKTLYKSVKLLLVHEWFLLKTLHVSLEEAKTIWLPK